MRKQKSEKLGVNLLGVYRKFFSLLGVNPTKLKGDELGLVDLLELSRKKFENSVKNEKEAFRWLYRRWHKYFKEEALWQEGTVVLRALFVERLQWPEITYFTGLTNANLRSLALVSLSEQVGFSELELRKERDCARNDIYIIDVLSKQRWSDGLSLNSEAMFMSHLDECSRCKKLFTKSQKWIRDQEKVEQTELSFSDLEEMFDLRDPVGSTGELFLKSFFGVILVLGVVFGIPYIPKVTKLINITVQNSFLRNSNPVKVEEEPSFEESEVVKTQETSETPVAPDVPEVPEVPEVKTPKLEKKSKPKPVEKLEAKADATTKAFYRWQAKAEDPQALSVQILDILTSLKVKNLGRLRMGAAYKGGRSFHISIDKSEYSLFLKQVKVLPFLTFSVAESKGSTSVPVERSRIVLWIGPNRE